MLVYLNTLYLNFRFVVLICLTMPITGETGLGLDLPFVLAFFCT